MIFSSFFFSLQKQATFRKNFIRKVKPTKIFKNKVFDDECKTFFTENRNSGDFYNCGIDKIWNLFE